MEVKGKLFLYKDAATQDKEDPVEDDFFIHLAELGSTSLFESTGQEKLVFASRQAAQYNEKILHKYL